MVSEESEAFRRLTRSVFSAQSALLKHGDKANEQFGQTSARWRVMLQVSNGQSSVAEIARVIGYSRQAVQRLSLALIDEGIFTVAPDGSDGRKQRLLLTTAGSLTLRRMEKHFESWSSRLVKELSTESLLALANSLEHISKIVLADCREFDTSVEHHDG